MSKNNWVATFSVVYTYSVAVEAEDRVKAWDIVQETSPYALTDRHEESDHRQLHVLAVDPAGDSGQISLFRSVDDDMDEPLGYRCAPDDVECESCQ
jgi:hypothetical protein